jgi:hypothetical protein
MSKDRQNHGWVTWHLAHQYPGVWFCPHHNTPLMSSRLKSTGVDRFLWCLPANDELTAWDQYTRPMGADALASLAAFISRLYALKLQDGELSVDAMQAVIRTELLERGWMTAAGQLRLAALSKPYLDHVRPLRVLPELNALAEDEHEVKTQVGRLLRPMRSGTHPLRWLVMANWLFGSAETFLRAVRISAAQRSEEPPFTVCEPTNLKNTHGEVDIRQKIVERARAGESVTSLATEAHVDVTTVMAWVAAAGILVERRPKKLKVDRLEPLLSDLRGGMGRDEAAKRHAISLATVDKILRTEVGLHQVWRTVRLERARTDARSIWSALNDQSPGAGAKLMRFMEPKTYAWLYRNDRAWLVDNSPSRQRDVTPQKTSVRWDERDLALSQQVQRALDELQQAGGGRRVHLWQVYQAVPELKPKLHVLARLPLTKRALESAVAFRRKAPDKSDRLI